MWLFYRHHQSTVNIWMCPLLKYLLKDPDKKVWEGLYFCNAVSLPHVDPNPYDCLPSVEQQMFSTANITVLHVVHHWQWHIFTWHLNTRDNDTPQTRITSCRRFSLNNTSNECLFLTRSITSAPEDQHERVTEYYGAPRDIAMKKKRRDANVFAFP